MGLDTLRVRYSLVLELNRFTNVHLFEKGFYQVRAKISGPPNSAVICESLQLDNRDCTSQELGPGIQDNTAISSTFKVIMKKAVIKLRNAFIFSIDIPGDVCNFVRSCTVPITIQFELFHAKLISRPKNPDSLEPCTVLSVDLNYSPVYGLHYCKEDMFEYLYMAQIRYTVHMVMVDIDNPPHTLLSQCWDNHLPVLSVLGAPVDHYKELILNVASILCGSLLSASDFLKSTFSNLQDTLPTEYRRELAPADAVSALQQILSSLSELDAIDDAQDQLIHDLKNISRGIHILWFEFLECFVHSKHIQQVLLERFRAVQLERLKEACFTQSHAKEKCAEYKSATLSSSLGSFVRSSRYISTIPPLPLHCNDNDGEASALPVILEDLYNWEPYSDNPNISVPKEILERAMQEKRVWDPIMRRPHIVVQLDEVVIREWRESQQCSLKDNTPPELHDVIERPRSIAVNGDSRHRQPSSHLPYALPPSSSESTSQTNHTNSVASSTFYTTTEDANNLLIVDLEPNAHQEVVQVAKPDRPPPPKPLNSSLVPEEHATINDLARKTIRLLKSEVTHINFEQARRDLIGSSLLNCVYFLTDTEGSRMMSTVYSPTPHLVVCAHGLEGASNDLRQVRIFLQLALPKSDLHFLMSEANMDDTYQDIKEMGRLLAEEIVQTINCSPKDYERISFIGHSLGSLVIRAAIQDKQLERHLPKFHTFLALSGPHLGMMYSPSYLVNGGLWLMQRLKSGKSLQQISMRDHSDLKQCFIYKLSERDKLHRFKNVVLLSSHQDRYVPFHSARIEVCSEARRDYSYNGLACREMVHNIIQPIIDTADCSLVRYSVQYALEQGSANTMIGRAAHIACLDSEVFLYKFFSVTAWKYFV